MDNLEKQLKERDKQIERIMTAFNGYVKKSDECENYYKDIIIDLKLKLLEANK